MEKTASFSDRKLAYEAVIELLAHQFAYPVKWIETQDALLRDAEINKITEIGPSSTLTVMAKRTVAAKYKDHDQALSIERELLSYEDDTQAVLFENQAFEEPEPLETVEFEKKVEVPVPVPVQEVPKSQPETSSHASFTATPISDEAVSAEMLTKAVIAFRLKKKISEVDSTNSIKMLARGRSTLENEIVGDLLLEFGSVAERAEELSIQELAHGLQTGSYSGSPGKVTTSMIDKFIALKMPSGFDKSAIFAYLSNRWGLPSGRQVNVLLSGVCKSPSARFQDQKSCETFFDTEAEQYLKSAGLALPTMSESVSHTTNASSNLVDPEFVKTQKHLYRQKLEMYAKALDIDLNAGVKDSEQLRQSLDSLQRELAMWSEEHGEEYGDGIKPLFNPSKIRTYDSSWAWATQELLSLFHELQSQETAIDRAEIESRCHAIANRATSDTIDVIRYLITQCDENRNDASMFNSRTALQNAMDMIKSNQACPLFRFDSTTEDCHSLEIKRKTVSGYVTDSKLTTLYSEAHRLLRQPGISFAGRHILMTGVGPSSIGWYILRGLLSGGAKVVVTTASYSTHRMKEYQQLYVESGARGSHLKVFPFNQGSRTDVRSLVDYIYDPKGLNWDLDTIIPFAALSGQGDIANIGSKAELAHRVMLTNIIRLVGAVKNHKEKRDLDSSPTTVLLPLSANHGIFGGDGLYSESKLGLETLFNRWYSEGWQDYLCICGVGIGWTRGTGLMKSNDSLVDALESKAGIKTFSQVEMAANILALLHHNLAEPLEMQPLYADFNGGLDLVSDFSKVFHDIRKALKETRDLELAVKLDASLDPPMKDIARPNHDLIKPRARIRIQVPRLPSYETEVKPLPNLEGMVDVDTVVVIAGFSELGPWGNSRTRWDMESSSTFTLEGWVEMAWMMGLIRYASSEFRNGKKLRPGWLDIKTGEPVHDSDIEAKYGQQVLSHSGIRLVEPELWGGYDPKKKKFFQEIALQGDLTPFDASEEVALEFKREHGSHCVIIDGKVQLKKGATLFIPKAAEFKTTVAGQLPTGFNPRTYGITDEIIAQVDPLSLYALICSVEALFSAGISDPYELYKYIHTSEVGTCIGTGVGPVKSAADMYKGRTLEREIASDVLQETFPNTVGAWVNMLLLSSNGAIRTPVGACATAIESLESAHDMITTGKAKLCLVGGVDDLEEHSAYEFAMMKATNANVIDFAAGREPSDMSRPAASDRRGFVESQGCGIQVVCTARLALDMGLPIHGIVAYAGMSGDKVGRSVPAPGKGVLSNARERLPSIPSPLLDLNYRRKQIDSRMKHVEQFEEEEMEQIEQDLIGLALSDQDKEEFKTHRKSYISHEAQRQRSNILYTYGNNFWRSNSQISPLRGSLATWGLTIDDLDVVSFHGTSTVKNEKNECDIVQRQLTHLGRAKGNRVLGVFQKHLTGHPKGPAGAWMINGCLQILDTGLVPGNKNADNIDAQLEQYDRIAFLNKNIQTTGVKAASVMSFGFGQKGGQAIIIHPKYMFSAISPKKYEEYCTTAKSRYQKATSEFERRMVEGQLFEAKTLSPFVGRREMEALLDPDIRL